MPTVLRFVQLTAVPFSKMLVGLTEDGRVYYTMVGEKDVTAVKQIPLMLWTPVACMERTFNPDEELEDDKGVTLMPPSSVSTQKAPPGMQMRMEVIPPLPPDATRVMDPGMDKCIHGTPKDRACRMCLAQPPGANAPVGETQQVWTPPVEIAAPVHMAGEPPVSPLLVPGVQQFNPIPAIPVGDVQGPLPGDVDENETDESGETGETGETPETAERPGLASLAEGGQLTDEQIKAVTEGVEPPADAPSTEPK